MKKLARSPSYPRALIEKGYIGKASGGRVLVTVVVWLPSPMAVVTLDLQGFFGNVELSLELWTVIAGISGFDD